MYINPTNNKSRSNLCMLQLVLLTNLNKVEKSYLYGVPNSLGCHISLTTGLSYIFVWVSRFNWLAHSGSESVIWCLLHLYAGLQQSNHLHSRVSGEIYCREPPAASSHCLRLLWSWWEVSTACSLSINADYSDREYLTAFFLGLLEPAFLAFEFKGQVCNRVAIELVKA